MINHLQSTEQKINAIDNLFGLYLEWRNEKDKFNKFVNLQGEAPLFKVNEVEFKYLKAEIEQAIAKKEEEWKSSNSDGSQENTSKNG